MSEKFQQENRYIVLKRTDLAEALEPDEMETLRHLCAKVRTHRTLIGKVPLLCVVVESDWPEYEPVWRAIQQRGSALCAIQKPQAWLVTGSKTFRDAVVSTEDMADRRIADRGKGDTSQKVPLYGCVPALMVSESTSLEIVRPAYVPDDIRALSPSGEGEGGETGE